MLPRDNASFMRAKLPPKHDEVELAPDCTSGYLGVPQRTLEYFGVPSSTLEQLRLP